MAERIGARNGTGGAVLREIMRLGRNFWARRVWVDLRKVLCYTGSGCLCTAGASDSKWEGQPGKWELKEGDVVVRPTPLCLSHGVAHSVCLWRRACCSTSTRPP